MSVSRQRKPNRLSIYDYHQNGWYFVTICTVERRCILSDVVGDDAHIVPRYYGQVAERFLCTIPGIDKYVIMPNHIHMIIKQEQGSMWASTPTSSLSQTIRSFKTMVTKTIGKSIFQRSFYDHIIRGYEDYQEIWRYIDNNPKKWQEDRFYK